MSSTKPFNFYLKHFLIFPKTSVIYHIMLFGNIILRNRSLKTIETLRIIKTNCSKYTGILRKIKKMIKNETKMSGGKCTKQRYKYIYKLEKRML